MIYGYNNGVTLFYISAGWNLAAARVKRGNAWSFNAISWFRDAALMKGSQNQRAYPHSTRGWGSFLITLGHWLHLAILSSTPRVSVMLLFYRDAMEQAIRKRQLQGHSHYPFLLFSAGSRIFALLMLIWSFHLASDRSKRLHRVARYRHLVLMVKVERQKWLTIHIPRSRVTDDIRLKNEALSPSARIAAADLVARSRPSPIQRQGLKGNTPRLVAWLGPLS